MSDMQESQRRVLITGGASGFGLAIAEALLARRARARKPPNTWVTPTTCCV